MKKIDWSKSNLLVDSYLNHLHNPDEIPGKFGRTWMEFEAQRLGIVESARDWKFGESHALWYACLIRNNRAYEVNRAEKAVGLVKGRTTLGTIRQLRRGRMRDTVTARMLEEMMLQK